MLTGRKTVQKKDLVQNAAFSLKVADAKGYKGPYDTKMATPMKTSHQLLESIEVRLELKEGDVSEFRKKK